MASLTTLFVVGPEEYIEFNESLGSKASLEHIWDQQTTPLKPEETSLSGSKLHSAGVRITSGHPPVIEFPIIKRVRGRGNTFKQTGKYLSWCELKQRNPSAIADPPDVETFLRQGAQVGTGERLAPGQLLKAAKIIKMLPERSKPRKVDVEQSSDGWYDGVSEKSNAEDTLQKEVAANDVALQGSAASIYAPKPLQSSEPALQIQGASVDATEPPNQMAMNVSTHLLVDESRASAPSSSGGDTPKPSPRITAQQSPSPPNHQRAARPPKIMLPSASASMAAHLSGRLSASSPRVRTPIAQTPLSETHPPPETPMKHDWQRGDSQEIQMTPRTEEAIGHSIASRQARGGLLLDPGSGLLPQGLQTPPVNRSLQLQNNDSSSATSMTRLPSSKLANAAEPQDAAARAAAPSPPPVKQSGSGGRSQIDEMLAKLRLARSSGSGASMWAPKADAPQANAIAEENKFKQMSPPAAPSVASLSAEKAQTPTSMKTKEYAEAKSSKSLLDRIGPAAVASNSNTPTTAAPDSSPEVDGKRRNRPKRDRNVTPKANEGTVKEPPPRSLLDRLDPASIADAHAKKMPSPPLHEVRRESRDKQSKGGNKSGRPPRAEDEGNTSPKGEKVPGIDPLDKEGGIESKSQATITSKGPSTRQQNADVHAPANEYESKEFKSAETRVEIGDESQMGNETMSSVNWADDDDDESLPDLPEDWTRSTSNHFSSPEKETNQVADVSARPGSPSKVRQPARRGGINKSRNARRGAKPNGGTESAHAHVPLHHSRGKGTLSSPSSPRPPDSSPKQRSFGNGRRQSGGGNANKGKELFPESQSAITESKSLESEKNTSPRNGTRSRFAANGEAEARPRSSHQMRNPKSKAQDK